MQSDTLAAALGVRPMTAVQKVIEPTDIVQASERIVSSGSRGVDEDFALARDATQQAITKGLAALDEIIAVAKLSEHPRAYEVASTMVNTVTHAAEVLMKLQKQRQEITNTDPEAPQAERQVNVVVMSTSDMLREIRKEIGR